LNFPFLVPALDVLPLVPEFLPSPDPQMEFYEAALQIKSEWNEGQALFRDLSLKLLDLTSVQEKLPVAKGLVIGPAAVGIRTDMGPDEKDLPVPYIRVSFLDVGFPVPDGLNLGPLQGDPRLEGFQDFVTEPRAAVFH